MKKQKKFQNKRPPLPQGSRRVIHPDLGVRVWEIDGKYYHSRADYYKTLVVTKGIAVDTSIGLVRP